MLKALRHLTETLKTLKTTPDNGIAFFSYEERCYTIIPLAPIREFIYRCDRKFHVDLIEPLCKVQNQTKYGLVLVTGKGASLYSVESLTPTLLKQIKTELQKRQKKGGSSAARISRLAEEKRTIYARQIVEAMNTSFISSNISQVVIAGGEIRDLISKHTLLDYRLTILDSVAISEISGMSDFQAFLQNNFKNIITRHQQKADIELLETIFSEIDSENSKFVYGNTELKEALDKIAVLYVLNSFKDHELVALLDQSKITFIGDEVAESEKLRQFGGMIAKLFY